MTTEDAAAAREKLHKFAHELADQLGRNGADFISETNAAETIEAAILSAFPHLTAPTEDVVEGVADILIEYDADMRVKDANGLRDKLAAFAVAHAAKERAVGFDAARDEAVRITQAQFTRAGRNKGEPESTRELILNLLLSDLRTMTLGIATRARSTP